MVNCFFYLILAAHLFQMTLPRGIFEFNFLYFIKPASQVFIPMAPSLAWVVLVATKSHVK